MGLMVSHILSRCLYSKKEVNILMVGLDEAGKTTILYQLVKREVVPTIPTYGYNLETVDHRNISFAVCDIGGDNRIRRLWQYFYTNRKAIIFVVDSTDSERLVEAEEEFRNLLCEDELKDASVLVLANKQDLENALTPAQISDKLGLCQLHGRQWHIQGTSATRGVGLFEGLDWLSVHIPKE